jgi:hypothetical protein
LLQNGSWGSFFFFYLLSVWRWGDRECWGKHLSPGPLMIGPLQDDLQEVLVFSAADGGSSISNEDGMQLSLPSASAITRRTR